MPCNRVVYRTASCRSRHTFSSKSRETLAGYPRTHHLSQPTASTLATLTSWDFPVLCHDDRGLSRAGLRDAGGMQDMPSKGGPQRSAATRSYCVDHCPTSLPTQQPKRPWGSKRRAVANGAGPKPPPPRRGSGTAAVTDTSCSVPACVLFWLSPGSTCRLPSMRVCACCVGRDLVTDGDARRKKKEKNCWCLSHPSFPF